VKFGPALNSKGELPFLDGKPTSGLGLVQIGFYGQVVFMQIGIARSSHTKRRSIAAGEQARLNQAKS